jgi:hypothetical protein
MRNRVTLLFVVFWSTIAAAQTPAPPVDELTLANDSATHLQGTYRYQDVTIRFDSYRVEDRVRVRLSAPRGEWLTAAADGKTFELTVLQEVKLSGSFPLARQNPAVDVSGDVRRLAALTQLDEYRILPGLSNALAARKIVGSTHPAAIYLHALALGSLEAGTKQGAVTAVLVVQPPVICDEGPGNDCDLRRDPYGTECFGMCGRGTCCWKRVCGDCCGYEGCFQHDVTCRYCDCGAWANLGQCALCYTTISFLGPSPCKRVENAGERKPPRCP